MCLREATSLYDVTPRRRGTDAEAARTHARASSFCQGLPPHSKYQKGCHSECCESDCLGMRVDDEIRTDQHRYVASLSSEPEPLLTTILLYAYLRLGLELGVCIPILRLS